MIHINPDIRDILRAIPSHLHGDIYTIFEEHQFPSQEFENFLDSNYGHVQYEAARVKFSGLNKADRHLLSGLLLSSEEVKHQFMYNS